MQNNKIYSRIFKKNVNLRKILEEERLYEHDHLLFQGGIF